MKTALISGARGQDASYLAEFLLEKGYKVIAFERRISNPNYINIAHLLDEQNYILEGGDITDLASLSRLIQQYKPDEFYNLAAMSYVAASWTEPLATCQNDFMGVANCLEAIRLNHPGTKFFQASTSEVYGDVQNDLQTLDTPARPRSPYGAAKHGAESLVKVYRESYNLFACWARSFNHGSPRRGKEFVTRKITSAVADMYLTTDQWVNNVWSKEHGPGSISVPEAFNHMLQNGLIKPIRLGNLEAKRDWTHAKDIVRGMWMMLQQDQPDNYLFASGTARSIKELLDCAFEHVAGTKDWDAYVVIDPKFYRPAEVNLLCGDPAKASQKLGWFPEISFDELIEEMIEHDLGRKS